MHTLALVTVLEIEFVKIRHSPYDKLLWNEWKGNMPSAQLRENMLFASNFVVDNNVELILADYSRMSPPSREDQVWIARNTSAILQHSKLRRVANIKGSDIFQQLAIETIYEIASKTPMPCEVRDFLSEAEAKSWLFTVSS